MKESRSIEALAPRSHTATVRFYRVVTKQGKRKSKPACFWAGFVAFLFME
jgi:hypothetical protein